MKRKWPLIIAILVGTAGITFSALAFDVNSSFLANSNSVSSLVAAACSGDLNNDTVINDSDLPLMVNAILKGNPQNLCADLNEDTKTNVLDLQTLVNRILNPTTGNAYYVATNGRDSNNGSIDSPWATLNHAIQVAGPGDLIYMRGGEYTTNEVWIRGDRGMGGSPGQYLTIKSYPGEVASVGGSRWMDLEADFVRIEGLHFRMPYSLDAGGEGYQIVNNTFYGPQPDYGAIMCGGTNGLIQGNHIEITGGGSTLDHGIYLLNSTGTTIRGNYISGFYGYGIHMYDEDKGDHRPKPYENILIEGNIVVGSPNRSGIILGAHDSTVSINNVVIKNNIIYNNADVGILIKYEPISNIRIYNNVIYSNASGILILTAIDHLEIVNNILASNRGGHIEISGNLTNDLVTHNLYDQPASVGSGVTDAHPVFGNPLFVDANNGDFHLQAGSPAIDAGVDVGIPYLGAAPDLGAFEHQ
jgi:parallel beta-helix repeat protein